MANQPEENWEIVKKWFKLDQRSLYDRIVNVCFLCGTPPEKEKMDWDEWTNHKVFFIRSDFMPIFSSLFSNTKENGLNKYQIERVKFKPDILLKCRTYNSGEQNIATEIELNIKNFYLFDVNGQLVRNFAGLQIYKMYIQLGYFGNFEKIKHDNISDLLYNFEDIDTNKNYGITTLEVTSIQNIIVDTMPPNYSITIRGFFGTIFTSSRGAHGAVFRVNDKGRFKTNVTDGVLLWDMLVTLNNDLQEVATPKSTNSFNAENLTVDWTKLKTKNNKIYYSLTMNEKIKHTQELAGYAAKAMEKSQSLILSEEHLGYLKELKQEFPDYFNGIEVRKEYASPQEIMLYLSTLLESSSDEVNFEPVFKSYTDNGNNTHYFVNDIDSNILSSMKQHLKEVGMEVYDVIDVYNNKLPAIYNISYSEICTIEAPFFYWVNCFDIVEFKTKYFTSSSIYYYMNSDVPMDSFSVFSSELEFATVQSTNIIRMKAVASSSNE